MANCPSPVYPFVYGQGLTTQSDADTVPLQDPVKFEPPPPVAPPVTLLERRILRSPRMVTVVDVARVLVGRLDIKQVVDTRSRRN